MGKTMRASASRSRELDGFGAYLVSYSGGKDSTATLLWALEHLPRERLRVVFVDTTVEWPETYEYLDYIERELDVAIDRIRAGDRAMPPRVDGKPREDAMCYETSLFGMIRKRGRWPGPKYRFCTTYLKLWPLRLYAAEYENPLQIDGCRAAESKRRASYPWLDRNGHGNVSSPFLPPSPPVCHAILDWSERQVWDYLRARHILPNPIYNHATRCGCWCCIMGRPAGVLNFCRLHPDIAQEAADLEQEIGHNWTERRSIGNLLCQARAQIELFSVEPRFQVPREKLKENGENGREEASLPF